MCVVSIHCAEQSQFLKKNFDKTSRNEACEMLIAFDEVLYNHYGGDIQNLTNLATSLVGNLNAIYTR